MTTTTAYDAAERLREIVKPGGTVQFISRGSTRSGGEKMTVHAQRRDIGCIVVVERGAALMADLSRYADRLSVALFAEPGLIKGEYL